MFIPVRAGAHTGVSKEAAPGNHRAPRASEGSLSPPGSGTSSRPRSPNPRAGLAGLSTWGVVQTARGSARGGVSRTRRHGMTREKTVAQGAWGPRPHRAQCGRPWGRPIRPLALVCRSSTPIFDVYRNIFGSVSALSSSKNNFCRAHVSATGQLRSRCGPRTLDWAPPSGKPSRRVGEQVPRLEGSWGLCPDSGCCPATPGFGHRFVQMSFVIVAWAPGHCLPCVTVLTGLAEQRELFC